MEVFRNSANIGCKVRWSCSDGRVILKSLLDLASDLSSVYWNFLALSE